MSTPVPDTTPVIVAALRTPIGTAGHAFADLTVDRLAAPVLAELAGRTAGLGAVDDVILGNCLGPGGNVARISALAAGLGSGTPGVTVDRQCGSGLDAILQASARIRAGYAGLVLAGGAESASTAPWRFLPPTPGAKPARYTRAPFAPAGMDDPEMGPAADTVARLSFITRERQDGYAARSHRLAATFRDAGGFDAECVPVQGVSRDERPRHGLDTTRLARLRPAFGAGGTVTAGNSCGISDGAAAVAVVPERLRAEHSLPGLRVLAATVTGSDPALPGLGPIPAVHQLLSDTGIDLGAIDRFEITEAFAGQLLAVTDALGIDESKVCVDGGAIALGHPWGASGAILAVRLFHQMLGEELDLGLAACAIGGGQGIAVLLQRVAGDG